MIIKPVMSQFGFYFYFILFEMVPHVDQANFKLMFLRVSLHFWSSCFYLPSAGTAGMDHQDPGFCGDENWTQSFVTC